MAWPRCPLSVPQVNGVDLHEAEHHQAVEALRGAGSTVQMRLWRERMVEPENAVTVTPLRPEDDSSPRLRLPLLPAEPASPRPLRQRHVACLVRSEKGLGFSIAGGKGSTPYRASDGVRRGGAGPFRSGWGCREGMDGNPGAERSLLPCSCPWPLLCLCRVSSSLASQRVELPTGQAPCRLETGSSR